MAQPKLEMLQTPAGIAIYPHLNKPDTRFNPEGQYQVKLRIPSEEAKDLIAQIDAVIADEVAKAKKENPKKAVKMATKPYAVALDDEGNETDEITFSFKAKAVLTLKDGTKLPTSIKLFDSKGNAFPQEDIIWGGSKIKVAFNAAPFNTAMAGIGASLRIKAVQVIDLVTGGSGNASSFGFGEEEGYVASPKSVETEATDAEETVDF